MTILPDGRWRMSAAELDARIWVNLKNWRLDPTDSRCLIPNFPPCTKRSLETICKPCGAESNLGWACSKFDTRVTVAYCTVCAGRGDNEQVQAAPEEGAVVTEDNQQLLPESVPDLLGTEPEDSGE